MDGKIKVSHVGFLKQLHLELCQLQPSDWIQLLRHQGLQPTPTKASRVTTAHGNNEETRKRRQRAYKVCSVLKQPGQARGGETTFYCSTCKLKTASKHALASLRRKRKLRARKPARVRGGDESDGAHLCGLSSDTSASAAPPLRRQRTHPIDVSEI
ncbi:Hypothetical protein PHPALM_36996 [Phytophthora palmivora]|uniref:Uncharacterized protein n=1 Tax=Phytophthora palmivora TaxID=4796 RepID=A0A2P4WYI0_9STRA|nr:Hypothetical protein PHPALM_36996 [Phytophthora palmivora]